MKTNIFFTEQQGLDNLVFENRNKQYGAYELRLHYEDRLSVALFATLSFFMLFFAVYYYTHRPADISLLIDCNGGCELPPPPSGNKKVIEIGLPPQLFSDPVASTTVVPRLVRNHISTDEEMLPNPGNNGDISNGTGTGIELGFNPGGTGTGNDEIILPKNPEVKPTEFITFFDEAPEFTGGLHAYEKYLQENIKYPEFAIQNGIQGTIFINAKINERGQVVGVELLKGIGGGCDEEAMRVIKNMPDWKPGRMNGKPVAVKCVLKVKMLLN